MGDRLKLFIGKRNTGIAIERDAQWPTMWRVRQGDRVSDIVNLTRAKDAALSWFTQANGGGIGERHIEWK